MKSLLSILIVGVILIYFAGSLLQTAGNHRLDKEVQAGSTSGTQYYPAPMGGSSLMVTNRVRHEWKREKQRRTNPHTSGSGDRCSNVRQCRGF
ncbi:MAG: hypothetical protein AB8B91_04075 [Rubripirellula sp.]